MEIGKTNLRVSIIGVDEYTEKLNTLNKNLLECKG